jgi:hypothetical protein
MCLLSFEQFIKQQMISFQNFISKHLHHHTFSSMHTDKVFKSHFVQILSCFSLRTSAWFIIWPNFLAFQLFSLVFFTMFRTQLGLPHNAIASIYWCVCTHPINPMGINLLCYAHDDERIGTHDVVCYTFVDIACNVDFHIGWGQLYVFPSTMFNFFRRRLDKDGIHTLVDIIIADPTWVDLFPQSYETQGFVAFDVVQTKERSYCDQHPIDQFLPLASEVFGCLHKQDDVFLHNCANVIWSLKRL